MNIQVLVATMHQTDHSLPEKMNIQTDAIIGNQCDRNEVEDFEWNGHKIKYLSFAERGVGLNRNNALMRASADVCLFADDDMVFVADYEKIITTSFANDENGTYNKWNGYLILPILAAVLTYGSVKVSSFISKRKAQKKNLQVVQTPEAGKGMQFIMPIIMVLRSADKYIRN